jgi:hypothetical protein
MFRAMMLAGLLFLSSAIPADACHRCGIFGRGCRFATTSYTHAAYQAPSQTLVFNNVTPPPPYLLAQQGTTAYGQIVPSVGLSAQSYNAFDPAAWMHEAAQFQRLALETAQRGNDGFNAAGATAMAVTDSLNRRQSNTLVTLAAIQANNQSALATTQGGGAAGGTVQTMRITTTNGRLSIEQGDPLTGEFRSQALGLACARCHDGQPGPGKPPPSLIYDGQTPINKEQLELAVEAIMSGKMPPNADLTLQQRSSLVAGVARSLIK